MTTPFLKTGDRIAVTIRVRSQEEPATVVRVRHDGTAVAVLDAVPGVPFLCTDWRKLRTKGEN